MTKKKMNPQICQLFVIDMHKQVISISYFMKLMSISSGAVTKRSGKEQYMMRYQIKEDLRKFAGVLSKLGL